MLYSRDVCVVTDPSPPPADNCVDRADGTRNRIDPVNVTHHANLVWLSHIEASDTGVRSGSDESRESCGSEIEDAIDCGPAKFVERSTEDHR